MKIEESQTEATILIELGKRLSQTRIQMGITQAQLALKTGLGKKTVERIEAGASVQLVSFLKLIRELNLIDTLDLLVPEVGAGPMDLLKLKGKTRKRASTSSSATDEAAPKWEWGE